MVMRSRRFEEVGRSDGQLKIKALRGGTISEVTTFLNDMDAAYNALYSLYAFPVITLPEDLEEVHYFLFSSRLDIIRRRAFEALYQNTLLRSKDSRALVAEQVQPEFRLELNRVSIQSPGFWEFIGGLNPLQQLREYLQERHKRRQDRDYKEQSEKERLRLDNEILEQTLGSGLIDQSQYVTIAAMQMLEKKVWAHRS